MSDDRERQFQKLVKDFPDSPMGHFSLGKLYLDLRRYAESAHCLEEACRLDPDYAAALVALGDAHAGQGNVEQAKKSYQQARNTPLGKKDISLQGDIEGRLADL